ncbi:hypothetical protein ACQPZX_07770 [Actinoplanes sp. CA-142083]|uniref:hypothetical protein n=1 Tax=Actinoplanes sp. CA-142083 TaxID=3239903 RepID=UPI003D9262C5
MDPDFLDSMRARLAAALDPTEAIRQLDAVPVNQPLAARLLAVIDILDAYYVHARAGFDDHRAPTARPFSRDDFRAITSVPETQQAVTRLLEPDRDRLRLPPDVLTKAFLGMSSGPARTTLSAAQLVDLFLNGAPL